jgi:indole-3-glycerol phosphate synthase
MKAETQASGVLGAILAETVARLRGRSGERAQWERRAAAAKAPPPFAARLRGPSVGVIAEVKRRSPSAGGIREGADAVALAAGFARAGAAALSVLTEQTHFGGSLDDLERVARQVELPVLRKDFIVDPLQVYEARAAGASAILLIVRALTDERLAALASLAQQIGLEVLVEVHGSLELARAVAVRPPAIGVNARDLETLAVDPAVVAALLPAVPGEIVAVAESGLATRVDIERVAGAGADAVLVGTAAAKAADPGAVIASLVGVQRRGRVGEMKRGSVSA